MLRFLFQLLNFTDQVGQHIFTFLRQLGQGPYVLSLSCQSGIQFDVTLQPASHPQDRLRLSLVVPELRVGCFLFKFENL